MNSFWDFDELLPNFTGWDQSDEPELDIDLQMNINQCQAAANSSVPE